MYKVIIGSPGESQSTSAYLVSLLELEKIKEIYVKDLAFNFEDGDVLLICSPLYVDGLPTNMLRYLEALTDWLSYNPKDLKVYGLITSGFPEGHQTALALEMLNRFCYVNELEWRGGLGMGAGVFLRNSIKLPLITWIRQPMHTNLHKLSHAIKTSSVFITTYTQPRMPKWLFKKLITYYWYSVAAENGLTKDDIKTTSMCSI